MKTISLLFTLLLSVNLAAAEKWKISDHPAMMKRTVSAFTEPRASLIIKAQRSALLETFETPEGKILQGEGSMIIARQDSKLAAIALEQSKASLKSQMELLKKKETEKLIQLRVVTYRHLEMKRLEKLALKGKVARTGYDLAVFEHDRAKLQVNDIDAAIAVQKQNVAEKQLTIKRSEEELSRYQIYAPRGWLLNERRVEAGSWVSAGEQICQLVDMRELAVHVRLSEEEIAALRAKPIQLRAKLSGRKLKALIHRVDMNFDPISRKHLVELRLDAKQFAKPSSGIELELLLKIPYPRPAVMIPRRFILSKLEQDYVKLSNGTLVAVTALRQNKEGLTVNAANLPADAVLIEVGKQ